MYRIYQTAFWLIALFSISACKEEIVTVEVEVPAQTAFTEIPSSVDLYRRVFDLTSFGDRLLLQS